MSDQPRPFAQAPGLDKAISEIDGYKPETIHVEHAQKILQQCVVPIQDTETLGLYHGLGRVLAEDIISPIDVPPHDNSAMDGYAFCGKDLDTNQPTRLRIVGSAFAGHAYTNEVVAGTCVRIMTGASMPKGCDTVIPQELVQTATDVEVIIPTDAITAGDNCRSRGEDLRKGSAALMRGRLLRPADLGLIASLGIAEVTVFRQLRVAFFSTGDELRSLGEPLEEGKVYDSNRFTIYGMLTRLGCDVIDMGIVNDNPEALEATLHEACEKADVVITSGGVSVGDADYSKQIIEKLGSVLFWKIAMRPGRPLAFGKIQSKGKSAWLFGLPGNPVAVMVNFYFFARPALLKMMGASETSLPLVRVISQDSIRKKPGRTEYQRGILTQGEDGILHVRLTGAQGSGILRSMSEANCIVVLPHEQGNVGAGEFVEVLLFDGLI